MYTTTNYGFNIVEGTDIVNPLTQLNPNFTALDTDLKTWANAQGWKLSNEDESIDISVDYDFDPEDVKEGVYKVTFSTTGREFKIHTTDYSAVGEEVGLTFFPEDIHVMSRMVFE